MSFELTPHEAMLHGVRLDAGRLRFGPSGAQDIQSGLFLTVGIMVGAIIAIVSVKSDSVFGIVAGSIATIAAVVTGISLRTQSVTADPAGIHTRTLLRSRTIEWDDVCSIDAISTTPQRWTPRIGISGLSLRWRWVGSWSGGTLTLTDGTTVELPTFVSAARGEGLNMGGPTPSEQRVAILDRFRGVVTSVRND